MTPGHLQPQHFITRDNGTMVPMIAVDELPAAINIQGVSRALSQFDIAGMTSIGVVPARHRQYVVDNAAAFHSFDAGIALVARSNTPKTSTADVGADPQFIQDTTSTPGNSLMASVYATSSPHHGVQALSNKSKLFILPTTKSYKAPSKAFGIEEQAPAQVASRVSKPAGPVPPRVDHNATPQLATSLPPWHNPADLPLQTAPGVKQYCSFWLRHGECDYAQQGCLYRHEMPLDRATLQSLGLRDIPRWYREKHRLGSYLASGSTPAEPATASNEKQEPMTKQGYNHASRPAIERATTRPKPAAAKEANTNIKTTSVSQQQTSPKPTQQTIKTKTSTGVNYPPLTQPPTTKLTSNIFASCSQNHPPTQPKQQQQQQPDPAQQIIDCIATLDAQDGRDRERDLLAEKYPLLIADEPVTTVSSVANSVKAANSVSSDVSRNNDGHGPSSASSTVSASGPANRDDVSKTSEVDNGQETGNGSEISSILRSPADGDLEGSTAGLGDNIFAEQPTETKKASGKVQIFRGISKDHRKSSVRAGYFKNTHRK